MKAIAFVTQKGGREELPVHQPRHSRSGSGPLGLHPRDGSPGDRQRLVREPHRRRSRGRPDRDLAGRRRDQEAEARGLRLMLIDTPGVDSAGTLAAIRAADLCLIPCRPTPADLRAFKPALAAVYRLDKEFAFVLNQAPPRSYRVRDASDGLAALGMLADVTIVTRNDHQDAIGMGQGVTEFNPGGQAADEVRRLWAWLERRVRHASGERTDFIGNRASQGKKDVKAA